MRALADIDLFREHRRADGIDARDRRADDRLHDVDVVNHEVEHDIDVGAALPIRREPVALNEPRRVQIRLRGQDRGVEALEMPDLEDPLLPRRELDQLRALPPPFR